MAYVMGNIRYVTFDVIYHKKMAASKIEGLFHILYYMIFLIFKKCFLTFSHFLQHDKKTSHVLFKLANFYWCTAFILLHNLI